MKKIFFLILYFFTVCGICGTDTAKDGFATCLHPTLGYEFQYPEKLLFRDTGEKKLGLESFYSADKKTHLFVWDSEPKDRTSWRTEYELNLEIRKNSGITYKVFKDRFFVISGIHGDEIFYSKEIRVPVKGGERFLIFEMAFPKDSKNLWDPILVACLRSLKPISTNAEGPVPTPGNPGEKDYEKNYSAQTEHDLAQEGFILIPSLKAKLMKLGEKLSFPMELDDSDLEKVRQQPCPRFGTVIGDVKNVPLNGRGYREVFFSPTGKSALLLQFVYTPFFSAHIGPLIAHNRIDFNYYKGQTEDWTYQDGMAADDSENDEDLANVDFEEAFVEDQGRVYLKTNQGFYAFDESGNVVLNLKGDSYLSRDEKFLTYSDGTQIKVFDLEHFTDAAFPPVDWKDVYGVSDFGDYLLVANHSKTDVNRSAFDILDRSGKSQWNLDKYMQPIDFVYPDNKENRDGFFVFYDGPNKKFVYFRTKDGKLTLTVPLPTFEKDFENPWVGPIALSNDGNLLAFQVKAKTYMKNPNRIIVINIKGDVLWTSDEPADRISFAKDDRLVVFGKKIKTYSLER